MHPSNLPTTKPENIYYQLRWFILLTVLFWLIGLLIIRNNVYGQEVLFFNAYRANPWNLVFRGITHLGEAYAFIVAGLVSILLKQYPSTLMVLATGIINLPIGYFLKDLMRIERPLTWLKNNHMLEQLIVVPNVELASGFTSFPSGHTMAAFSLYTLLALLTKHLSAWMGFGWALLAILVAVSRMFLAQHFLPDVLAGSVLGIFLGWTVWQIFKKITASPSQIT